MLRHKEHQEAKVSTNQMLPQFFRPRDVRHARRRLLGQSRLAQRRRGVREGDRKHQQHREESSGNDATLQRSLAEEHRTGQMIIRIVVIFSSVKLPYANDLLS